MFVLVFFVYVTLTTAANYDDLEVKCGGAKCMDQTEIEILKSRENFTNCDAFLDNTTFDITRVLNVSWEVFYVWFDINAADTQHLPNIIINFQLPSSLLIKRFQDGIKNERNSSINWNAAELLMEVNSDFSFVLLATNQSGLFDSVPSIAIEHPLHTGPLLTALKIVEPHYVGVMNCQYRQLLALAPASQKPTEQEMEFVAKQFKFNSSYGVPYHILQNKIKQETTQRQTYSGEEDRELSMIYDDPNENNIHIF